MNARRLLLLAACLTSSAACAAPRTDSRGDALPAGAVARLGTVRLRHGGPVTSVAFAPDGRSVASASFDRTVSLWDAASGRELVRYRGHTADVRAVAFAPDSNTLASGGNDGKVRVWEVPRSFPPSGPASGKELLVFNHTPESVEAVAFSPDGTLLAAGDSNGVVIRNIAQRKLVRILALDAPVRCLAFAPSGKFLAVNDKKKAVKIWEVATGSEIASFGDETVRCLAFSPDGRWLAGGDFGNTVRVWDITSGAERCRFTGHPSVAGPFNFIFGVAFAPDGKTVASGGGDGGVCLWDPETGKEKRRLTGHTAHVTSVAFAPDGKTLVSGGGDNRVRLWNTATGAETTATRSTGSPLTGLSLAADGKTLAALRSDGHLDLWDVPARKQRPLMREMGLWQGKYRAAAFAPAGQTLAVGIAPGSLRLVDLATNKVVFVGPDGEGPLAPLAFTSDNRSVLGGHHRAVVRRDLPGGKLSADGEKKMDALSCLAVTSDGRTLVAGGSAGIRLWHPDTRETVDLPGSTFALALSPDGHSLARVGTNPMIGIWEVSSGKLRKSLGGHSGWVRALAYSSDGRLLASGGDDGTVRVWDARTGREMADFSGHRGKVVGVVFTPHGRQLISAGSDSTVLLWDLASVPRTPTAGAVTYRAEQLEDLWERLGGEGPAAFVAVQKLARSPAQTVALLQSRVRPVDAGRVERALKDLDSEYFETREQASEELAALGQAAERRLREMLRGKISAESRRRLVELVAKLHAGERAPEVLRALRAVEVLEMLGTPEAKKLLAALAAGAKEFEVTIHAKAALERMGK